MGVVERYRKTGSELDKLILRKRILFQFISMHNFLKNWKKLLLSPLNQCLKICKGWLEFVQNPRLRPLSFRCREFTGRCHLEFIWETVKTDTDWKTIQNMAPYGVKNYYKQLHSGNPPQTESTLIRSEAWRICIITKADQTATCSLLGEIP